MDYYKVIESLQCLAERDDSEPYEVDYSFVGYEKETGEFALVTASGCSCWDGGCDVTMFKGLDDMEKSLMTTDHKWSPSFKFAKELMAEARETWFKIQSKDFNPFLMA